MLRNQDRLSILLELAQDLCSLALECSNEFSSHIVILKWHFHKGKGMGSARIPILSSPRGRSSKLQHSDVVGCFGAVERLKSTFDRTGKQKFNQARILSARRQLAI